MKPHIIHVSLPGLLRQGKSFAPLPGKTTSKNSFSVKPFFWWYLYFLVRINKMVSSLDYHPSPARLAQGCILSYFYELLRALSLSSECLLNFLSSVYILPCVGKIFNFMEFSFLENAIIRGIFTHAPPLSPPSSCHHALGRRKLLIPQVAFFRKSVSRNSRNRWRKLWFALSKFSQKIWRWLGTLGFLCFVWFAIISNVMTLQFCE